MVAAIEIIVDRELHQVFLKDKLGVHNVWGGGRKQAWHFKCAIIINKQVIASACTYLALYGLTPRPS